jgi:hypothetical protein
MDPQVSTLQAPALAALICELQNAVDDPMWPDHVEMPKRTLRAVVSALAASKVTAPSDADLMELAECAGIITGENLRRNGPSGDYMLMRSIGEAVNVRSDHLLTFARSVVACHPPANKQPAPKVAERN